jgi:transposase
MDTADTVVRTISVPLAHVKDEEWIELRRFAYKCAAFCNHMISEQYVVRKGFAEKEPGKGFQTYTDFNKELSSRVRDALTKEITAVWKREGKKIFKGERSLSLFTADRSICVRDTGIKIYRDGDQFFCSLMLQPHTWQAFQLYVRGKYIGKTVRFLADHPESVRKVSLVFRRPGRKIFCRISFQKVIGFPVPGEKSAALVTVPDGQVFLKCEGARISFTHECYRLAHLKEHYAGIHKRLQVSLNMRGKRHRYRAALAKAGNFTEASLGLLHAFARKIVQWSVEQSAGEITIALDRSKFDLPWDRLITLIENKAQEHGIFVRVSEPAGQEKNPDESASV